MDETLLRLQRPVLREPKLRRLDGSLGIVVTTGLIGRTIYAWAPRGDTPIELPELLGELRLLELEARSLISSGGRLAALAGLVREATAPAVETLLPLQLLLAIASTIRFRVRLVVATRRLPAPLRARVRRVLSRLHWLRWQTVLFDRVRRLMRLWRGLHASLAALLVVALVAHVGLAWYLGYHPR